MKKKRVLVVLFCIVFLMQCSTLAFARAGGGGSSSSGGGGTAVSSSSNTRRGYYGGSGVRGSLIEYIIGSLLIPSVVYVIRRGNVLVIKVKTTGKYIKTKRIILNLKRKNNIYSKKDLNRNVENIYFDLQEAWTNMDYTHVKEYMSEDLYIMHKVKLGWMAVNKQQNILQKIKLLSAKPIGIQHYLDSYKDVVWFYIKGSMIDYIINSETKEVIDGSTWPKRFIEYWRFVRKDGRWVIDKISQIDEIDIDREIPIYIEV